MTIKDNVKEMEMYDLLGNCVYIKDNETWYRDFEVDMPLRDFFRKIMKEHDILPSNCENDEFFDEFMIDARQYGYESLDGILAYWYGNLVAMAEYRKEVKIASEITRKQSDFILAKGLEEEKRLEGFVPKVKITDKDRNFGNVTFKKGVHIYFCGHCNSVISRIQKYCPECGNKIAWDKAKKMDNWKDGLLDKFNKSY